MNRTGSSDGETYTHTKEGQDTGVYGVAADKAHEIEEEGKVSCLLGKEILHTEDVHANWSD